MKDMSMKKVKIKMVHCNIEIIIKSMSTKDVCIGSGPID